MLTCPSEILRTASAPNIYFCQASTETSDQVMVWTEDELFVSGVVLCLPAVWVSTRIGLELITPK